MKALKHFTKGVNLGGWLSQYGSESEEHFDTFITQEDIRRIASWGFDHVRLPVDYPVLEKGYGYIDACMNWCRQEGLGLVLDLHKAPGFSFENGFDNPLLTDPDLRKQFVQLWKDIAAHYSKENDFLMFELINEVHAKDQNQLDDLYAETVTAIRDISPDRKILLGSNRGNQAEELKNMRFYDDENIIYGFHFYDPFAFTHQRADWVPVEKFLDAVQPYPGKMEKADLFLQIIPQEKEDEEKIRNLVFDRSYLEEKMKSVDDFSAESEKTVYCGELGAIDLADSKSRCRWLSDVSAVMKQRNIGYAVWNYKEMGFGLVREDGSVPDREVLKVLTEQ